jgi:hypothetical protein
MPRMKLVMDREAPGSLAVAAPPVAPEEAPPVAEEATDEAPPAREDFHTVMVVEETWTGDGRFFESGCFEWRDLPLPFMADDINNEAHVASVKVGNITRVERLGNEIHGWGPFDEVDGSPHGQRVQFLQNKIRNGELRGVSADFDSPDLTLEIPMESSDVEFDPETGEPVMPEDDVMRIEFNAETMPREVWHGARIMGATALPFPAIQEAYVEFLAAAGAHPQLPGRLTGWTVVEEAEAVLASAAIRPPAVPPRDWFDDPGFTEPTACTVLDSGEYLGHIADSTSCHIGYMNECVTAPRSASNYANYRLGEVLCDDGSRVAVGRITVGTGHADPRLRAAAAAAHYDNTGSAVVDVACGEDEFGIWVHGAVRPDATPEQIRTLMASPPSGDWRAIGGNLELIGVLAVNIPGFPIRRSMAASAEPRPQVRVAISEGILQTLIASLPPQPLRRVARTARSGNGASAAVRERYARMVGRDSATLNARRIAAVRERIGR